MDGCRGGWFSVGFDGDGGYTYEVFDDLWQAAGMLRGRKTDPCGYTDWPPGGCKGRNADREARKKLRPRGSTVFPTPTRRTALQAAVSREDYLAAVNVEFDLTGKKISKQAFAIAPKIAEVDKLMLARGKDAKPCVREVHPELCFWGLNRGNPLTSKKKRVAGRKDRLRVLQSVEGRAEEYIQQGLRQVSKEGR